MTKPYTATQTFVDYFNSFYGSNGIYPVRDVTQEEINAALVIRHKNPHAVDFEGDSVDREAIRDIIFTQPEIDKAYTK